MRPRQVFRDAERQARFEKEGYVILPLLDRIDVDRLSTEIAAICSPALPINNPHLISYLSYFDVHRRQAASDLIKAVIGPRLAGHLTGYHILASTTFQRHGHAPPLPAHLHTPHIADYTDTVLNCWCPLVDCDEDSGVLQVVPRSQRLLWHVQTMSPSPPFWSQIDARMTEKYLKALKVLAGEAVIFEDSLVHASCQNLRDEPRVATVSQLIPNDSVSAFYVESEEPGGGIEIYSAFNEFSYSDIVHGRMPPRDTWKMLGTLPNRRVQLNEAQFDALLANGLRIAPGVDPYQGVASLGMVPADTAPVPASPAQHRPRGRRALGRLRREAGRLRRWALG